MFTTTPRFLSPKDARSELVIQARRMTIRSFIDRDGTVIKSMTGKGETARTNDDVFIAFAMACYLPLKIRAEDFKFFENHRIVL